MSSPASDPDEPFAARRSRAAYLEQLSARILRSAEKSLKDRPRPLQELTAHIGELLIELRKAEEACRKLEAQLQALSMRHSDLLDRVPVPCVVTDERGAVVNVNRDALLLLHASERQIVANPVVVWFKDRAAARDLAARLPSLTAPMHREMEVAPRDRRVFTSSIVVQRVEGVTPALFRWFFIAGQ